MKNFNTAVEIMEGAFDVLKAQHFSIVEGYMEVDQDVRTFQRMSRLFDKFIVVCAEVALHDENLAKAYMEMADYMLFQARDILIVYVKDDVVKEKNDAVVDIDTDEDDVLEGKVYHVDLEKTPVDDFPF